VVAEIGGVGGEALADRVRERSASSYCVDRNKKKRQTKMRRKGRRSVKITQRRCLRWGGEKKRSRGVRWRKERKERWDRVGRCRGMASPGTERKRQGHRGRERGKRKKGKKKREREKF
jgi:hypothetical protein